MDSFILDGMPVIAFGTAIFNEADELIENYALKNLKTKKALIMTGNNYLRQSGKAGELISALDKRSIKSEIFEGVSANPRASEVNEAADIIKKSDYDFVIGFGGGSAIDAAKAAAALAASGGCDILDYFEATNDKPRKITAALPVISIPTRYGSSAEISIFSVINDQAAREKKVLTSPLLMPQLAIIDPVFCTDLSMEQIAHAVTDITAHLIETYISGTDTSPVADSLTEALVYELIKNYFKIKTSGASIEIHENIFYISLLALSGITHVGRGGDFPLHDLQHPLSAHFDIPHGLGLGALFPYLMRHSFEYASGRYEKLYTNVFKRLNNESKYFNAYKESNDELERASITVECFTEFFTITGTHKKLSDYGLNENNIEKLADDVIRLYGHGKMYIAGPNKLRYSDIIEIYSKTL